MAVSHEEQSRVRSRKLQAPTGLVRRSLMVDPKDLEELHALYETSSDSEALRRAVSAALLVAQAHKVQDLLAETGGLDDVYGRTTGKSRLPYHHTPEELAAAAAEDDEDPPG